MIGKSMEGGDGDSKSRRTWNELLEDLCFIRGYEAEEVTNCDSITLFCFLFIYSSISFRIANQLFKKLVSFDD